MTLKLLATTIEVLLNKLLQSDPPSLVALQPLTGKTLRVEISGLDWQFTLFPGPQGILVKTDYPGPTDSQISGAPFSLLSLLLPANATLASAGVTVQGSISIAQQLLTIVKTWRLDWEENLADYLGDVPAHQLGRCCRQGQNYTNELTHQLPQQLSDYLQEEIRYFPAPAEVNAWFNEVDTLRNDLARLEQRVRRLHPFLPTT